MEATTPTEIRNADQINSIVKKVQSKDSDEEVEWREKPRTDKKRSSARSSDIEENIYRTKRTRSNSIEDRRKNKRKNSSDSDTYERERKSRRDGDRNRRDDRDRSGEKYQSDDRFRYRRDDRDRKEERYRSDDGDRYRRDDRDRRNDDRNKRGEVDKHKRDLDRREVDRSNPEDSIKKEDPDKIAEARKNDKKAKILALLKKDEDETKKKKLQEETALESELNPTITIEECSCRKFDGRVIKLQVIRDDNLVGGTKQRALYKYLQQQFPDISEFVFAGPSTSFLQVALAVTCARLKKRCTLFIQHPSPTKPPSLTALAKKLGATAQVFYDQLADTQARAVEYVDLKNQETDEVMLIPLHLDNEEYGELLYSQLARSITSNSRKPKRLWLTANTGTFLRAIARVWTETEFMPVAVSKKLLEADYGSELWSRMGGSERVDFLMAPQNFSQSVPQNMIPPYASVPTYDAKVWQFVMKYGDEGDYIWNCAGEEITKLSNK